VRVVADAQFGDILSVAPAKALNAAYAPRYDRSPRIIHVPQPGGRDDRTSINQRGGPALSNEDDDEEIASPPRRRVPPKPQQRSDEPRRKPFSASPSPQRRSDAPPPPGPGRAVLSAPPPPAEGLTPVRPTPRFNSKSDPIEKFGARDPTVTSSTPPVGYTPPSGLPRND
jgi:hypothetical protein